MPCSAWSAANSFQIRDLTTSNPTANCDQGLTLPANSQVIPIFDVIPSPLRRHLGQRW